MNRKILNLAIPNIISNVSVPMRNAMLISTFLVFFPVYFYFYTVYRKPWIMAGVYILYGITWYYYGLYIKESGIF